MRASGRTHWGIGCERKTSPERPRDSASSQATAAQGLTCAESLLERRKKSLMVTQFEFPYVSGFFFLIKKRDKIQRQECA